MKYLKMLSLLAVGAAALMAFVGTASADVVTSPTGTTYTSTIKATSTNSHLTGTITISCEHSTLEGSITGHGKGVEVSGTVSKLTFEKCGSTTVTTVKGGTLKLHVDKTNEGTLTSDGAEVTVLLHSGILGTEHCIYKTENDSIGTVTGGKPATLHATSQPIGRVVTGSFCGSHATWNGDYTVTTPSELHLDVS